MALTRKKVKVKIQAVTGSRVVRTWEKTPPIDSEATLGPRV